LGENVAVNRAAGDEGEKGGGRRWRAVEDGGGKNGKISLLPDFERADLAL
jgi:hypothetical protein